MRAQQTLEKQPIILLPPSQLRAFPQEPLRKKTNEVSFITGL